MDLSGVLDPGDDLVELEAALDACFDKPLSCLSKNELSNRLIDVHRVTAKLDALRAETIRACDLAQVGSLTDQRNTSNHLATLTNADPADVRFDSRIGTWLLDMAILAEAYRAGRISAAHIELLRKADNDRVHLQMVRDQSDFLTWFTTCHFRDLESLINEWLLGADPDGAEPTEHLAEAGLSIKPLPGGRGKVSAILDPLQLAALRGAIGTESRKLRAEEESTGARNTVRRRQLVALLNLIGRGAARADGSFARPRVNIVMSQSVYEKTLDWLADPANGLPEVDRSNIDKRCHLIDGTPIHPLYALAATATATFRRFVYGIRGRPIEISYDSRQVPDWMQDASLIATNGKCTNPVCDAPFDWLHGDHIQPFSNSQETRLDESRPLCEGDNLWRGNDTDRGKWPVPDVDPDAIASRQQQQQ